MISMERNSEKGWQGTTLNTMCSLIPWPPQGWVPAWGKKRKLGRKVFEVLHERRQGKELEVVHEYHHQHGREHKMNRRPDEKNCKQRTESWIDYTQCINIHRLIMHTVHSQTLFSSVNIWSSIFLKSLTKALFWYRWMPTLLFSICVVGIGGCLIDESLAGMKLPHHPAYVWSVCVFEEFWLGTWTLKCRKPKKQSGQNKLILLTNITIVKHNFVHLTICKFVNLQILSLRRREPLLQLCPPPFILAINTGLAIYF